MHFTSMDDVRAYYARTAIQRHLYYQAGSLCNMLCHKLDWTHDTARIARINHALGRARARLERRGNAREDR